jgi:bacillopeptidase F
MAQARVFRWFGVLGFLVLLLAAVPAQASTATATYLVGLADDGTQALADGARTISNKQSRRTEVNRLLGERATRNRSNLDAFLVGRGLASDVSAVTTFKTFNGFSVTGTQRAIDALRGWSRVISVEPDTPIQLDLPTAGLNEPTVNAVEWNIAKIGADRVQTELTINGTGVLVGNLDSGVRFTHEALSASYKCAGGSHTNCWLDAISGQAAPYDDNNHGTHTMGTAVGSGGIGVAPGAKWIACKAFNASGSGNQTDILECFDWFLAPGGSAANAPDVVNNSWGSSQGSSTAYQQGVTNWVNASIYPAFSNGNSGPSCNTVGAPASYANAVGTGATDINDLIASFSSRGPSPFGVGKPDLSAPGVNVRSSVASSDNAYASFNGTSMAAPHVTGLVAMLLDATNGALTIDQMTSNMKTNALGIAATGCNSSGIPNNIYGWGRIRAYESVQAALGNPPPPPVQPPAAPSNLTATAPSSTQVNLSWQDNANNEDGFKIERCSGRGCTNFGQIAQAGANVTTYSDTTVSPRTNYSYRVRAFNANGNSSYSNTASVRTRR